MTVKFSGTFKADEREYNGLEAIIDALIDRPLDRHVCVVVVETKKIVKDIADGGTTTPTVRTVHIEPLDGADADEAKAMLDRAYKARTNRDAAPQDTLPFDGDGPAAERNRDEWLGEADRR